MKDKVRAFYESSAIHITNKQLSDHFGVPVDDIVKWKKEDKENPWKYGLKEPLDKLKDETFKKAARETFENPYNGINTVKDVATFLGIAVADVQRWYTDDKKNKQPWNHVGSRIGNAKIKNIVNETISAQEQAFCNHYMVSFNPKLAAIDSGYTANGDNPTTIGYKLLGMPHIKKEIARLRELMGNSIMLNAQSIIDRHMQIAFSDMAAVIDYGYRDEKIPTVDSNGQITGYIEDKKFYYEVKPIKMVDSTLIKTFKMGKYGPEITLEDRSKSLEFLSNYVTIAKLSEQIKIDILKKKLDMTGDVTPAKMVEMLKQMSDTELLEFMQSLQQ